jgi:hypothetical protein
MNLKYYISNYFTIISRVFLNEDEKNFIKKIKNEKKSYDSNNVIIIHIVEDYYSLIHTYFLLKENSFLNHRLVGLWTSCIPREDGILKFFKFIFYVLIDYLIKKKWQVLYKSIGINVFYNLNNNLLSNIITKKTRFFLKEKNSKNKDSILKIKYRKIVIGDLIYDYYIRFFRRYTYQKNDSHLIMRILNYCEYSFQNLNKILKKEKRIKFYIPQLSSSYIQYGLPIRFFINNNVNTVGCFNSSQYIKKFTKNDYFSTFNQSKLKKIFIKIKNKKKIILLAKKKITEKFNGKINNEIRYMKKSAYEKNKITIIQKKIDVIIFLPSFDDAQHYYGNFVFCDFYDWIYETLNFLKSFKDFKIAIKPHPNQTYFSSTFVEKLKLEFKNYFWINPTVSNQYIFLKKPLFGLSVGGTVLHELAYHGIVPISAGKNPHSSYNFVFTPKNKKNYFELINHAFKKKIKLPKNFKNEILKFYYTYYLHNNDYMINYSRKVNLLKFRSRVPENDMSSLKQFNEDQIK